MARAALSEPLDDPVEAGEKTAGPRSRKGAETRARLLAAAKEIFEEDGFFDARISDIAKRARLSHGSFYHYFESKDEIFREVAAAVEDQLSAPLGDVILDPASKATPRQRISRALRTHLESYRHEARIMGVIEQVSRYDTQLLAMRTERHTVANEKVIDSLRQLQRRGMVDRRLDVRIATSILGSMTNRFPEMWLVEGALECDFEDAVKQLILLFVNAIGLTDEPTRRTKR